MGRSHELAAALMFSVLSGPAMAQGPAPLVVEVALESPVHEHVVDPAQAVPWSIRVTVSSEGRNLGLAAAICDLVMIDYPSTYTGLPMTAAAVPAGMEAFSRPLGISNAAPAGSGFNTGYGGTPLIVVYSDLGYPTPALIQIGGMQNTFGVAGVNMGTQAVCEAGIGQQAGGAILAAGEFPAPLKPGGYELNLRLCSANLFGSIGAPEQYSPVFEVPPEALIANSVLAFQVVCRADFNTDGAVTVQDLFDFLDAYFAVAPNADFDNNGVVTVNDLYVFLALYFTGCGS
jgi:hypothetical protein